MDKTVKLDVDIVGVGTPILLLHGFPDSRKLWEEMIPLFVNSGYQVIAPDMRGFGDSPLLPNEEDYKVELVIGDLIHLLDDLGIQAPVHLLGHDWGAVIAWCMAINHPNRVKSMVPVSVGHPMSYARAGLLQKWKGRYVIGFQLRGLAERWMSKDDFASLRSWGKQHPLIEDSISHMSRPGRLTAGLNYYRANLSDSLTGVWNKRCKVPTLGIWGSDDSMLTEDQMVNSEHYMDGPWSYQRLIVGHWIPLEQPDVLFNVVYDWHKSLARQ